MGSFQATVTAWKAFDEQAKNAMPRRKQRSLTGFHEVFDHRSHRCHAKDVPSRNFQVRRGFAVTGFVFGS
jgi:hypothetical protein